MELYRIQRPLSLLRLDSPGLVVSLDWGEKTGLLLASCLFLSGENKFGMPFLPQSHIRASK